jgi:hypothetical protein
LNPFFSFTASLLFDLRAATVPFLDEQVLKLVPSLSFSGPPGNICSHLCRLGFGDQAGVVLPVACDPLARLQLSFDTGLC